MRYCLLLVGVLCCAGAGPTTRPAAATKPAAAPAPPPRVRDALANGVVRFLVPAGWEMVDRTENGLVVRYRADGEVEATIGIQVTPQAQGVPVHDVRVRGQMARSLLPAITEDLKKRGVEILDAPKAVTDDRFMLKVHERFRENDGVLDVVHMYRGIGANLVDVTVTVVSEDKAQAKVLHDAAAQVAMSVVSGPKDPNIARPFKKE